MIYDSQAFNLVWRVHRPDTQLLEKTYGKVPISSCDGKHSQHVHTSKGHNEWFVKKPIVMARNKRKTTLPMKRDDAAVCSSLGREYEEEIGDYEK